MTRSRASPHAAFARRESIAGLIVSGAFAAPAGVFRGSSESGAGCAAMEQDDDSAGTGSGVVAMADQSGFPRGVFTAREQGDDMDYGIECLNAAADLGLAGVGANNITGAAAS